MRKTPVIEHQPDHAHQSTRYPPLHQVRSQPAGRKPYVGPAVVLLGATVLAVPRTPE
jgi:hypothetical protein